MVDSVGHVASPSVPLALGEGPVWYMPGVRPGWAQTLGIWQQQGGSKPLLGQWVCDTGLSGLI